jgi:hypothetical protein
MERGENEIDGQFERRAGTVHPKNSGLREDKQYASLPDNRVQSAKILKEHHFAKVVDQKLYEHEHYFIAQLYDDDWKPKPTV